MGQILEMGQSSDVQEGVYLPHTTTILPRRGNSRRSKRAQKAFACDGMMDSADTKNPDIPGILPLYQGFCFGLGERI